MAFNHQVAFFAAWHRYAAKREAHVERLPKHFRSCERQNMAGVADCNPPMIVAEVIFDSYSIISTGAPPAAVAAYYPACL